MATDRLTLAGFLAIVLLGGFNGVAVRAVDRELAPLWGAGLRFGIGAAVLLVIVAWRRVQFPRGAALVGSALYGLTGFAGAFGLIHVGLVRVPAGVGQVILALVPLLTFGLAVGVGLERFRWPSLAGAVIAIAGVVVVASNGAGGGAPVSSVLAIVGAAAFMAGSNVIAKRFPACHPLANNAVAMAVGAGTLLFVSIALGEPHAVPVAASTLWALAYLSVLGSVAVFSLFRFVIGRWRASTTSYVMLLMPLVSVIAASIVASEPVNPALVGGGVLVLVGVYVGAFASPGELAGADEDAPGGGSVSLKRPTTVVPGCS
jgi:drug/metabolite transporter (DMT)-like permease